MMSIHDLGGEVALLQAFQGLDTQRVVVYSHEEEVVTEPMELVREGLEPRKLFVQKLEVPCLLGVSIPSFKEAKRTFLIPEIGNMITFLLEPFS